MGFLERKTSRKLRAYIKVTDMNVDGRCHQGNLWDLMVLPIGQSEARTKQPGNLPPIVFAVDRKDPWRPLSPTLAGLAFGVFHTFKL